MMSFVLIVVLASPVFNGITTISQEFSSKETCEAARQDYEVNSALVVKVLRSKCYEK